MKITKHCVEHNDEELDITIEWKSEIVSTDTDRGTFNQEFFEPKEVTLDSTGDIWECEYDPEPGTWQNSVLNAFINQRIDYL